MKKILLVNTKYRKFGGEAVFIKKRESRFEDKATGARIFKRRKH